MDTEVRSAPTRRGRGHEGVPHSTKYTRAEQTDRDAQRCAGLAAGKEAGGLIKAVIFDVGGPLDMETKFEAAITALQVTEAKNAATPRL